MTPDRSCRDTVTVTGDPRRQQPPLEQRRVGGPARAGAGVVGEGLTRTVDFKSSLRAAGLPLGGKRGEGWGGRGTW